MQKFPSRAGAVLIATMVVATSCTGASRSAKTPSPAVVTTPATSAATTTTPSPTTTSARRAGFTVTAQSFGMHYLGFGSHPYPPLAFGTARIWDMGVTWKDLQPSASTSLTGRGDAALRKLDAIISTFRAHHVDPLITLGQTPAWAAHACRHVFHGFDWGAQTCAPNDPGMHGPWADYVRALATRYRNSVRYFELWNEPSLRNGYNDSPATLALMQRTAHRVLHSLGHGQQLVSPSIPFTEGGASSPQTHGLRWLDRFLALPGGTDFDVAGFHLYPSDPAAKAGYGPEWSVGVALPAVRAVLDAHGVGRRPLWNTETNVGRIPAGIRFSGSKAAAMLARTFVLAPENDVARTVWYGVNDYAFGGVAVEQGSSDTLSAAGHAEVYLQGLLLGASPTGCVHHEPGPTGRYSCSFTLADGKRLTVLWTTGTSYRIALPAGTTAFDVVGHWQATSSVVVGPVPVYLVGASNG